MNRTTRWVLGLATASLVAGSVLAATSASAAVTTNLAGTISCTNGQAVTGVWLDSQAGGSQWASWRAFPGRPADAFYSANVTYNQPGSYTMLHIGCGGTPQNWRSTNLTPWVWMRPGTFTVNSICDASQAGRRSSCTFPPAGPTTNHNEGFYGWCTWGAYEQWHNNMGYWPDISGNANQMDDNARAKGWRVTDVPSRRAMVVRNSGGGGYGHVAWVRNVRFDANGKVLLDITEMNGGRQVPGAEPGYTTMFGRYDDATVAWIPGDHQFIQAWN